ncbi:hypothetical protein RJ639_018912 [Escallonia herrerae]|uniref:Uncharacterized protein n=1 Tax=Escallonia herrerae TaxID=1293975 RepID=A0AA88VCQ9_9ASTE|nr:hypothetical protein RJ639_018912 [Escallonia herrerae]
MAHICRSTSGDEGSFPANEIGVCKILLMLRNDVLVKVLKENFVQMIPSQTNILPCNNINTYLKNFDASHYIPSILSHWVFYNLKMARGLKLVSSLFLIILLNAVFISTQARPLNILEPQSPDSAGIEGLLNRLALGAVKDGPSPGQGHKFTNRETLGGIKDSGPSPGQGHKYVTGTNQ